MGRTLVRFGHTHGNSHGSPLLCYRGQGSEAAVQSNVIGYVWFCVFYLSMQFPVGSAIHHMDLLSSHDSFFFMNRPN